MAQHPARQLNSKTIKDAVVSYVVPVVQKKFCVVSVNCVWRVQTDSASMTKAWELVCDKRAQCDGVIASLPGVAFFFSAIASKESNSSNKGKSNCDDIGNEAIIEEILNEGVSCSQRTNTSETSQCSAINTAVEKERLPAVSYWIAFESPNGAPISLVQLHRKLIDCEVEIDSKILTNRTGSTTELIKRLCTVFKDHSSSYLNDIVKGSFEACFMDAIQDLQSRNSQYEDVEKEQKEKVLRFVCDKNVNTKEVKRMIGALVNAGLQLDVDGFDSLVDDNETSHGKVMTTDPCTQLINDIEILMKHLGYAMYQGAVFKKVPSSKYTYRYKCEVNSFIGKYKLFFSIQYSFICH